MLILASWDKKMGLRSVLYNKTYTPLSLMGLENIQLFFLDNKWHALLGLMGLGSGSHEFIHTLA